jgi:broad specificity phosphatase PhoE
VILVRHAMPEVRPEVPAERWELGEAGRAAARALARALPPAPFVLSSDEPKARQTADAIVAVGGGTLAIDAGLAEAGRPPGWEADFRARAREYVGGREHAGWEPHAAVVARVDAAVRAGLRACGDTPLVVVGHGQALTLWLRDIGAIADAPRFWSELAFPDAWAADLAGHAPVRVA